ncbi:hypothetical protein [Nitrosopumilus sp. S4]
MKAQIELSSISMSKNDPKLSKLDKYDVEANIEEIDNSEDQSVFKYGFTALSNPKNVRLAIEGIARISGDSMERDEILTKDENDVPKILTMIYHELFPTFFLLSKSLNVSCPPHTIGSMGDGKLADVEDPQINESEIPVDDKPEINPKVSESSEQVSTPTSETVTEQTENPDIAQPTV